MKTEKMDKMLDELKDRLKFLLTIIPPKSKIVYLEYPLHSNIGDMLIMKGTEHFFKEYQIKVTKKFNIYDFNESHIKDEIIVFHGGGNFGDLYPSHQLFRESVIRLFPENKIVILPQTIHYNNETNLLNTATIINSHKDLHLFVRDNFSLEVATKHFSCNTHLLPDMAHQLWPLKSKKSGGGILGIMRRDSEIDHELEVDLNKYDLITDWPQLLKKQDYLAIEIIRKLARLSKKSHFINVYSIWSWYKDRLINKAIRLYSRYNKIESSRLHGFILGCLMNKEVYLLDNSYGKNSRYFKAHYNHKNFVG